MQDSFDQDRPDSPSDRLQSVTNSFGSEEGVYGVILVAGLIVVTGAENATAWSVFLAVVGTVLVFWAAHVYAGTVSRHGFGDGTTGLRKAFRDALHHSWGLLVSALIPACILLLGTSHIVSDPVAIWLALWTCVAVLAVLGFVAFTRRSSPWWVRLLGSLATAGFGMLMILLKAALH
ncbi:hypothetical protein LG299_10050 [Microbacterium lacus]|uniref:hypothetical protein n=1 Tax=Microbacterium lacus TaxID=415217 RepID=UPI00384FFA43